MESSESTLGVNSSDSDLLESAEANKSSSQKKDFQNPLFCNQHLPYQTSLEKEAEELLEAIKLNLSLSVQKHELWPGALYWTNRLRRYVRVPAKGVGIY